MAFIPFSYPSDVPGELLHMLPATGALNLVAGTALVLTGGKLALATGTVVPEYISYFTGTTTANQPIPVQRIVPGAVYSVAAPSGVAVGNAYTIGTDGGSITTTTTNGVAKILSITDGVANVVFK